MKETLSEIYKKEIHYQEIRSNKRTLRGFLAMFLMLLFVWFLTMIGFFVISKAMISFAVVCTAVMYVIPLMIWRTEDLSKPWIKYVLLALVCGACSLIISVLTFHAVLLCVLPMLFAAQYRRRHVLWSTFAVNAGCLTISYLVGFYCGICDLNLLLESAHNRSWYMDRVVNQTLQLPLNDNIIFTILVWEALPQIMILFVFALMIQYTIDSSQDDASRIAKLTYRKDLDGETKLYNKGKYDEMASKYYPRVERIAVAFFDLNNLKKVNDTHGHVAGDMMINAISQALLTACSSRCHAYRVGGDEFLLVLENPVAGEIEECIKKVKEKLSNSTEYSVVPVTAAVGYAYGSGKDIASVVNEADTMMYTDKRNSKQSRRF